MSDEMKRESGVPAMHYAVMLGIIGFLFIKAMVEPFVIKSLCDSVIICEREAKP